MDIFNQKNIRRIKKENAILKIKIAYENMQEDLKKEEIKFLDIIHTY